MTCFRLIVIAALPLALAACSAKAPHPHIDSLPVAERVVTSDRAVAVACLKPGQVAPPPGKVGGQTNGDLRHDADVFAAGLADAEAWMAKAYPALQACGD